MFEYTASLIKIVDGDTIDVQIDLGFKVYVTQRLRLARINCPEMKTPEGVAAKAAVTVWMGMRGAHHQSLRIQTGKTDKYNRYIAEVFIKDRDDKEYNISDELVKSGNAIYVKY